MYKTHISRVFALFALLAMLSGCGEKEITGQIFVVTQAKSNIKLALVAVGAIPQEEFDLFLKAKQSEKIEQQKLLLPKYELAEVAKAQLKAAEPHYEFIRTYKSTSEKERKKDESMLDAAKAKFDAANAVIVEYEAFNKAEFLLEGMPQPKFISKTDADGKFTLKLPKGKYVIKANSSRAVFGSSETYHWLVVVDTSNINQPLMLSNDNLLETKCNECVKF